MRYVRERFASTHKKSNSCLLLFNSPFTCPMWKSREIQFSHKAFSFVWTSRSSFCWNECRFYVELFRNRSELHYLLLLLSTITYWTGTLIALTKNKLLLKLYSIFYCTSYELIRNSLSTMLFRLTFSQCNLLFLQIFVLQRPLYSQFKY